MSKRDGIITGADHFRAAAEFKGDEFTPEWWDSPAGWAADYRILEWEAERRIESDRERLVQEQE